MFCFQDKEPRGIIPLENLGVREILDVKRPHCFEIFSDATSAIKACKTDSEGKVVEGQSSTLFTHLLLALENLLSVSVDQHAVISTMFFKANAELIVLLWCSVVFVFNAVVSMMQANLHH